jgi:hypothetical protein
LDQPVLTITHTPTALRFGDNDALRTAGQCFKMGKDFPKAIDANEKAAVAHKEAGDMFHAAKALEAAGDAAREHKDLRVRHPHFATPLYWPAPHRALQH